MAYKHIKTNGIGWLRDFEGTDAWYWGTDYTDGDLYEAEELFLDGHRINKNRLIFVSYPEGNVYEPVKARKGQYFGNAAFYEDSIFFLLADFNERELLIYKYVPGALEASVYERLSLDRVKNCYNLMLEISPLTLTRQGDEGRFQVVWPDKGDFEIEPSESFDMRDGDRLIFSKWFEDPDYREEIVVRKYPSGQVIKQFKGSLKHMPDGQKWILE